MDAAKLLSDEGWETLIGVALLDCSAAEAEAVARAAREHPAVAERLRRAEQTVSAAMAARSTAISAELRGRLIGLMPPVSLLDRAAERVRDVFAALVFDTRAEGAALAGFRGDAGNERHMMYAADDTEINLRISSLKTGRVAVMGEIHADGAPARVQFAALAAPDAKLDAELTQGTLFEIELPADTYQATVVFAERAVVIPILDLKPV